MPPPPYFSYREKRKSESDKFEGNFKIFNDEYDTGIHRADMYQYIRLFKYINEYLFLIKAYLVDFHGDLTRNERKSVKTTEDKFIRLLGKLLKEKINFFKDRAYSPEWIEIDGYPDVKELLLNSVFMPLTKSLKSVFDNLQMINLVDDHPKKKFFQQLNSIKESPKIPMYPIHLYNLLIIVNKLFKDGLEIKEYLDVNIICDLILNTEIPRKGSIGLILDILKNNIHQIVNDYDRVIVIQKYGIDSDGYEALKALPQVIEKCIKYIDQNCR